MNGFLIMRWGDLLEVEGQCPWCPVYEVHFHRFDPDTGKPDPEFIPAVRI